MDNSQESLLQARSLEEHDGRESSGYCGCFMPLLDSLTRFSNDLQEFFKKALEMGSTDPRKIVFAIKMGLALALASLLMFWEVSFTDLGQYSIWAIVTIIVMFEFSIGSTFIKGFNRGLGTLCAGILAFFWAELSRLSGDYEKVVIVLSFFVTASIASYFKLYPTMAPYEYGYRVFVMTFCILMVAGNRSKQYTMAILTRLVLIAFGGLICFIVNVSVYPIWSGEDLHRSVVKNFKDLAVSLQGCVDGYLEGVKYERIPSKIVMHQESDDPLYRGYRTVLESKSREQTLLGFAVWEPPHGRYKMRKYPWKNYVRLSDAVRHCAYTVMALHGCIMSEIQAPVEKRKVFYDELQKVGAEGAKVLHSIGSKVEKMEKLDQDGILEEVHKAAEKLQKIIDARSYHLVNTESWGIIRQDKNEEMEEEFRLQKGSKSLSESVIDLRSLHIPASLPADGLLKQAYRKRIPWPSPFPFEDVGLGKEDEIRTYESASSLSLATFASLLIEFAARLQHVVESFEELSEKADFKETIVSSSTPLPLAASSRSLGFFSSFIKTFRFKKRWDK